MAEENYHTHEELNEGEQDSPSAPPTGQVRIAAIEAAVAAGLVPSTSRTDFAPGPSADDAPAVEQSATVELPAWTAAPTGQVPRVLLDEDADQDDTGLVRRGPSWRQESSDWDEDVDLSIFADEEPADAAASIAGQGEEFDDEHPFSFGDLGLGDEFAERDEDSADDQAWASLLGDHAEPEPNDTYGLGSFGPSHLSDLSRKARKGRGAHRARQKASDEPTAVPSTARAEASTRRTLAAAPKKSALIATATGVVAAAVALGCFFGGALWTLVLATVVLTLAAGEVFAVLRRVGFRPATLPGLFVVAALVVGTYLRGTVAVPFFLALGFVGCGLLCLFGRLVRPVVNIGTTFGVICWVGVLGSFAGLLLSPSSHPHRHGVALIVGALAITVAHDIGSYAVGSRVGRRALAPGISPHKTLEGLIGGTIAAMLVAGLIISRIHPFTIGFAIELGVIVVVFAPLGDLVESVFKRDLGVKDMGSLLPGHGGILDRIDAMLFVLPATYYLASLHHLA